MNDVNELTLQLLLNQKNYNKLIQIKREELREDEDSIDIVKENKEEIINSITQLIDGDVDNLNNQIILAFDDFTNELFKHWEMLKIHNQDKFNDVKNNDDVSVHSSEDEDEEQSRETSSVWSSEKVSKLDK